MSSTYCQIGDFADVQGGLQVTHRREDLPLEVPYLRVANVFRDELDLREIKTLRVTPDELARARLQPNDILIVEGHGNPNEIGRASVWTGQIETCVHQNHLIRVRPDTRKAFAPYISAYLNSSLGRVHLVKAGKTTSGLNTINITNVREVPVLLPPLPEQKRIAAILDKADAIRRKREQAIRLTEELLRAAFLEMFGDPVTNPKGWEVRELGELGHWQSGGTPPRSEPQYFTGDVPWFSSGELNTTFVSESRERITSQALTATAAKSVPEGALLLGMYDTAALKASIAAIDCSCNQAVAFGILNTDAIDPLYLHTLITLGRDHFRRQQRGVRQKNLNLSLVRAIEVPVPPLNMQQRYSSICRATNLCTEHAGSADAAMSRLAATLSRQAFCGDL